MSGGDWLGDPRSLRAAERILDAAAALFAERGVAATQMADIARAAGCSRATLYRYFDSRRAVQLAFVHREARRLGTTLTADLRTIPDPTTRIVEGVLASLRAVRADPLLIAWFRPADAGTTIEIAQTSQVIESIATSLFGPESPDAQPDNALAARWLTRVIVSLLTVPGRDENEERLFLERFVAPLITGTRA
ncbi:TetR/AcrR family transcriptional regulator [Nocardia terpenica]|uniref:TetR family transcriptional regulator n=1 Tax=Nocardia terpenica TaxID=455432 RepID=A0A6G9YXN6_9NOCA|nr:TetR/AcrR family transcriptional regulator [Nocardia terpenica]QIS17583.1 TetR family transcriptional regulator [Nocardia terpenica]